VTTDRRAVDLCGHWFIPLPLVGGAHSQPTRSFPSPPARGLSLATSAHSRASGNPGTISGFKIFLDPRLRGGERKYMSSPHPLIPAQAGIQRQVQGFKILFWTPAYAGVSGNTSPRHIRSFPRKQESRDKFRVLKSCSGPPLTRGWAEIHVLVTPAHSRASGNPGGVRKFKVARAPSKGRAKLGFLDESAQASKPYSISWSDAREGKPPRATHMTRTKQASSRHNAGWSRGWDQYGVARHASQDRRSSRRRSYHSACSQECIQRKPRTMTRSPTGSKALVTRDGKKVIHHSHDMRPRNQPAHSRASGNPGTISGFKIFLDPRFRGGERKYMSSSHPLIPAQAGIQGQVQSLKFCSGPPLSRGWAEKVLRGSNFRLPLTRGWAEIHVLATSAHSRASGNPGTSSEF